MFHMNFKDGMDKWIVCRICLDKPSTGLESIFHQDVGKDLTLLIHECGGVPIQKFDHYPDKICTKCLQSLKEAYIFRKTCQHSHKRLSELIAPMEVDNGEQQRLAFVDEYTIEELEFKFDPTNTKVKIETETTKNMSYVFDDGMDEFVPEDKREITKFSAIDVSKSADIAVVDSKNQQIISNVEEEVDRNLELGVKMKVEIGENEMISEVFEVFDEGEEEFFKEEANAFDHEDDELIKKKKKIERAGCLGEMENELFSNTSDDEYVPHPKKSSSHKVNVKGKTKKQKSISGSRIKMSDTTKDEKLLPNTDCETHTNELIDERTCDICGKSFTKNSTLKRHKVEIHNMIDTNSNRETHKCEICERIFFQKNTLTCHMRTHTGERPYNCKICERTFGQKAQLTYHMRTHTGERPHKCSYCPKAFATPGARGIHHRTHTNERPHSCDICDKSFTQKKGLKTHKVEVHKIIDTERNRTIYQCELCESAFSEKVHLTYHMRAHTGERPYKCSDCPKAYTNPGALKWHYRTHANERAYTCDTCGKSFNQQRVLKIHKIEVHKIIDTDSNATIYQCELCERVFSAKIHLTYHMNTHTGERPYKCSDCPKTFANGGALKCHYRIHANDRPYTCDICGKSFTRKQIMQRHTVEVHKIIETDSNLETYQCE